MQAVLLVIVMIVVVVIKARHCGLVASCSGPDAFGVRPKLAANFGGRSSDDVLF